MTAPMIVRIALFGPSGAGKSTTGRLIAQRCQVAKVEFHRLSLAEPLYHAQTEIYRLARRPLEDPHVQDAELLAVLGQQMRRINPSALIDDFSDRLQVLLARVRSRSGRHIILCDDMRYHDWKALEQLQFVPVKIFATPEDCADRRRMRGDISSVSGIPWSEQGLDGITPAHTLANTGSLDDLAVAIERLFEELFI
ncbi:ATP-binding protein [Nocardia sp. NPDC004068]|uniref:ATP-binding protein n=1 Tax=Nocardia sp. NPDC004068 TaxID=3364303 RepID=UPI0036BB3462